jgi:hypothetical protein
MNHFGWESGRQYFGKGIGGTQTKLTMVIWKYI